MEHIYPAFVRGRIMKTELLHALQEYSYTALEIKYQSYTDGILTGCGLSTDDQFIIISPGIIKCQGFLFLIGKEERVSYQPGEAYVSLKFRIIGKEELPDCMRYESAFVLDEELTQKAGEIEIARFKLKQGSRLRYEYKDFYDIQTEYDTLNLLDSTWAGRSEATVSLPVMKCFAKEVLKQNGAREIDRYFAWQCLSTDSGIEMEIIRDFLSTSLEAVPYVHDKYEVYQLLGKQLKVIKDNQGTKGAQRRNPKQMIIVD